MLTQISSDCLAFDFKTRPWLVPLLNSTSADRRAARHMALRLMQQ